jgi:hypothetical protein
VPDEIRSCIISNSTFDQCNFGGSQWHRIQVEKTQFEGCDFRESSIRESSFVHCRFSLCRLKRSSLTLNNFDRCAFHEVDLGDCTAQFLFVDNCEFDRCRINAETVGFTYGLSERNLDSLELIYLGRRQAKPAKVNLINSLIENYWDRKWHVGACVLEFNFRRSSPITSLRRLVVALDAAAAQHLPFDWDELRFLVQVLQRLDGEQRLPLLGLWQLVDALHKVPSGSLPLSSFLTNVASAAEIVVGQADRLLLSMLDRLAPSLIMNEASDKNLRFDLTLSKRPVIPLAELIPTSIYDVFGGKKIEFIGGHEGSWVETWQLGLSALIAVQVSLVAVNGVMGQLIKAVERAQRLAEMVLTQGTRVATKQKALKAAHSRHREGRGMPSLSSAVAKQIETARLRTETLSVETLVRLDKALNALSLLQDHELEAFQAYAIDHLQAARVRPLPRGSTKRFDRGRQPSA